MRQVSDSGTALFKTRRKMLQNNSITYTDMKSPLVILHTVGSQKTNNCEISITIKARNQTDDMTLQTTNIT